MKITIVQGAFFPVPPVMGGAIEKVWFALGQEFARRGHSVVQISRAFPRFPRREAIAGVKHRRIRGYDTPLVRDAGFKVLAGNLFDSAIMKMSVISEPWLAVPCFGWSSPASSLAA